MLLHLGNGMREWQGMEAQGYIADAAVLWGVESENRERGNSLEHAARTHAANRVVGVHNDLALQLRPHVLSYALGRVAGDGQNDHIAERAGVRGGPDGDVRVLGRKLAELLWDGTAPWLVACTRRHVRGDIRYCVAMCAGVLR